MKKNKSQQLQSGFTLVELLVSMMVIAIVGSIILVIFFSVLRGSSKTDKIIQVRQSGNYAISQVTKMIRGARSISCVPPEEDLEFVTISDDNGSSTKIFCADGRITAEGETTSELADSSQVNVSCSFSCLQMPNSLMKLVGISMTVKANQDGEDSAPEDMATQEFKTSVVVRSAE